MLRTAVTASRLARAIPCPTSSPPIIAGSETRAFNSRAVDDDFDLHLMLPPQSARTDELPTLILLDSNDDFPLVSTIATRLADAGAIPVAIVGIGYSEHPRYYRIRDYTPTSDPESERPTGGGPAFLEFLSDELIPYLRTDLGLTGPVVIAGHSLGGLFSIYAYRERPNLVAAAIASSPSLWWDDQLLAESVGEARGRPLYTSLGSAETDLMTTAWDAFVTANREQETDVFRADLLLGENHSTGKLVAYPRAIRWILERFASHWSP